MLHKKENFICGLFLSGIEIELIRVCSIRIVIGVCSIRISFTKTPCLQKDMQRKVSHRHDE